MPKETAESGTDQVSTLSAAETAMQQLGLSDAEPVDDGAGDTTDEGNAADATAEDDSSEETVNDEEDSTEETEGEVEEEDEVGTEPLLTEDERAAAGKDPVKLEKALTKAFTQKTQKLAEARRFYERLQADPDKVIEELAAQRGVKIQKPEPAIKADTPDKVKTAMAKIVEVFGEDAAKPIIEYAEAVAEARVSPILEETRSVKLRDAANLAAVAAEDFKKAHPDYEKHLPAMQELAKKVNPNMSEREALEFLYENVTRGKREVGAVKKVLDRQKKAVAASEPRPKNVPASSVKPGAPKRMTARSAAEAAFDGIAY